MIDARGALASSANLVDALLPQLLSLRDTAQYKVDDTPVTAADVMIERRIEDHLHALLGDVNFVGEESRAGAKARDAEWTAVLDPIDGTENFVSGLPMWGVSLSLWRDGAHAASMLQFPELAQRLISGDEVPRFTSRITGLSSAIRPELSDELRNAGQARIMGSASYNLWCVIRGSFTRFINPVGAYSWDLLAGVLLAREYGCEVFVDGNEYDGRYLEPDREYRVEVQHR